MVCRHFPMFICSYSCVCLCVVLHVRASSPWCMCVNLLIQWCEAAGLWLSVQKHSKGRQDYNQFKCCFGHSVEIIQNGGTMVPSLNCSRLLLQVATFLRKNATCKCTMLFHCPSVNVWHFPDCGFSCMGQQKCWFCLCASRFTCVSVDVRVSKFG